MMKVKSYQFLFIILLLSGCDSVVDYNHSPGSNSYTMTKPGGCSLELRTGNSLSISNVNYACENTSNLDSLSQDLVKAIDHFQLKGLKEPNHLSLRIEAGEIRFPRLLENINNYKSWPTDFVEDFENNRRVAYSNNASIDKAKEEYKETVDRGEGIENHMDVDGYIELLRGVEARDKFVDNVEQVIIATRYMNNISGALSNAGCGKARLHVDAVAGFLNADNHGGVPDNIKSERLIREGLIKREEIAKENFPYINSIFIACN